VVAVLLDQTAPPFVSAELIGDGLAAGQPAILSAVGDCPGESVLPQAATGCPLTHVLGRFSCSG